ncbi:MAG: Multidrug export protein MepA [Firmicutes bacterium ADurb.Bin373]|nr:MAG: Multidrug export protein MepA [Firmicutes bacterium ADurb.Bin373]
MEAKFAKSAYWNFLIWGVCSSLGVTVSTFVDAVLVGNIIGSDGLAVVNISTPVFLVYSLFGLTIGVGANVLIGRRLGAADVEEANRVFNAQVFTGAVIGLLCLVFSVLLQDEICRFLGAKDALLPLGRQYLTVVFFSAPLFVLYHILAVSVRTDGDPKLAAISSATVILTNLSLDILFMVVLEWGIIGASASLCLAEALGMAVLLLHFGKKYSLLRFRLSLPGFADVKYFVVNGFGVGSAFIFQASVIFVFNILLLADGTGQGVMHVAIFGVIYTMSMIPFAVFDGAGSAISTVVSIFAGEKDGKSMLTVLRQGINIVSLAGVLVSVAFLFGVGGIVRFFGIAGDTALSTATLAFRIFAASILFTGINTVVTAFWQAIGRARLASVMSVMRNFLLILGLGFFLIPKNQIAGLSVAYVGSEVVCLLGILPVLLFSSSKSYIAEKFQPTNRIQEKYYTINTGSISRVSADLGQLCEDWEISSKQAFFINLIVEELILNIIKFGLKDKGKEHYISIKLLDNGGEYIVRIRDNVNTYNPFDSGGDEIDRAAIKMITAKTKYYDYQRKLIFNYLYLII